MLVHDYLINSARAYPEKTALVCEEERVTYAQLDERSNQLARELVSRGVRRGDRVIVFLPNSVESAVAIFGVLKAGGVFVPANHGMKADKLGYIRKDCEAVAIVTNPNGAKLLARRSGDFSHLKVVVRTDSVQGEIPGQAVVTLPELYDRVDPTSVDVPVVDQDLACLIYTSGSTGEPKGVVCGHNNVVFASGSIVTYLENVTDDIVINVLPFSFDYGLYQLLMVFRFSGTLVIENAFAYPAAILRTMEREKVTGFPAVPTLVSIMLTMDLGSYDLSSLRYITNTAAALPPTHIQQLQERLPWVRIYSMYGLTECKRTLYLPPERLRDKPGSVGVAIPGTEVWLEDEEGRRLGPDEIGELVVRGSHVMRGYWNDDALTARVYRKGPTPGERVLHTGDLFRMDEEGLLYFVSRSDDIIKSRGEKVAPKEVEAVLCELAGIAEAAVVGEPDEVLGQAIKAYCVKVDDNLTDMEVRRHCTRRLESYMVPNSVVFVTSLPKTSSGKVNKRELATVG